MQLVIIVVLERMHNKQKCSLLNDYLEDYNHLMRNKESYAENTKLVNEALETLEKTKLTGTNKEEIEQAESDRKSLSMNYDEDCETN